MVACSDGDGSWYLAQGVRRLAEGYVENDRLLHIAARELARLLPLVRWPSDFAIFDQGSMVIEETTHGLSPFSIHRNVIGRRRSLYRSALGKSALLAAEKGDREMMIDLAKSFENEALPDPRFVERLHADFVDRGYTWSIGGSEERISAIAVPVHGMERVIGAVNIIFFRSASTPEKIADLYLDHLKDCAARIETGAAALPSA
jgi:IclR family mhp operon transcriptional activator